MRKMMVLFVWLSAGAGFIYLANCSKPLDIDRIADTGPDTVFISDTITDTLYDDTTIIDTLIVDTLIIDTLIIDSTIVDTIYIDSMFCARLSAHRREIVWILFNQPGTYRLDFLAIAERIRRSQTLNVNIDGHTYSWIPADNFHYWVEQDLGQYAVIRITSTPAHAYGQAIDICLSVSEP
jgi:hypothetical protein